MEDYKDFNANGQVIFIEPTWVTGETCLFTIDDPIVYMKAQIKLTKIRKEFISRLEKEGFVITYNKRDTREDIIGFIMNNEAICGPTTDVAFYKKEFDKRMFQMGGDKLNYPLSVKMEEFFLNPFYPAVFKNEIMNGGVDKFLIETPEQLEIIKKFYNRFSNDPRYKAAFGCSIFQQFIETPTDSKTYMRILMSASGDVMGASLKYSKINNQKRESSGMFEPYFYDEHSEYFLNCKGMFNYYSGGGNISFHQPRYSFEKQAILEAHGLDPDNLTIPNDVLEVASSIAQKCNKELGIMCGIDFMLNKKDNKWYYLELQAFPAIEEWAEARNIKSVKVKNADDYIRYCALELEARHEALMMCMNKKLSYTNGEGDKPKSYNLKLK